MKTLHDAVTRIEGLLSAGVPIKKIRAQLVIEDYPSKVINEAVKALGKVAQRKGFKAAFFDWLAEAPRTKQEATDFINGLDPVFGDTSDDVKRSMSTNINIWNLSVRIWAKANSKTESEVNPEVEAARAALNKAKAAWAKGTAPKNKNAFHPDKVSYLNDEALTRAYTQFFQDITA